jgi:chorismate dehydratase
LRVGIVHYVNSRPLAWGLLHGAAGESFVGERLAPAAIADRLTSGMLDVGLVPSIELARIPGLVVVPGLAIAALHEVRSVLLVSKVPAAEIRSVALDENSRTSAALVRILLADRYGIRPELRAAPARLPSMLADADAALLIGDPALAVERERFVVLDLAGEWLELTGLPFVFAVWAARRGSATPALAAALEASFAAGWAALDEIVAEAARDTGLPLSVLRDYYTRNLRYRMGPAEHAGLAEFLRRAHLHGLAPAPRPLEFLGATAASRG